MDAPKQQSEHRLLMKMLGSWTFESSCDMGPGKPPQTFKGRETVRPLGDLWVICEGEGETPGGGTSQMIITLGFDPARQKFVGTFIASMMTHLWPYEGSLDATGTIITLDSTGPDFAEPTVMKPYRDVIEIRSEQERYLTSQMCTADGTWQEFMRATYRRVSR